MSVMTWLLTTPDCVMTSEATVTHTGEKRCSTEIIALDFQTVCYFFS